MEKTHHPTNHDPSPDINPPQRPVQLLPTHVIIIHIHPLRRQPSQRILRLLPLVVESTIEPQVVDDVPHLLVAPRRADDSQSLPLGELAYDLADCARGAADEDGLSRLGLADLVEGGVRCESGVVEGAEKVGEGKVMWVRRVREDALDVGGCFGGGEGCVLGYGEVG